ncbi:uncharacterized protein LOC34620504 [Cyclospora cayetanensis]|nr:uncharacterized protein LOC34620504 [Cyclospora cayetanensis]
MAGLTSASLLLWVLLLSPWKAPALLAGSLITNTARPSRGGVAGGSLAFASRSMHAKLRASWVPPKAHSAAESLRNLACWPPLASLRQSLCRVNFQLFAADGRIPSHPYERLRRLVDLKKQEVQQLQVQHQAMTDPLQLRQHYVSHCHNGKLIEKLRIRRETGQLKLSLQRQLAAASDSTQQQETVQQQLKLLSQIRAHSESATHHVHTKECEHERQQSDGSDGRSGGPRSAEECLKALQQEDPDETTLSVVCDIKRCSNVSTRGRPYRLAFNDAAEVVVPLAEAGADVLLMATDREAWGGCLEDLQKARKALTGAYTFSQRPALVMKDLVIHPIQIAQAAEAGADGVYLIHSVAGGALEELLFAACTAGIEAVVEVHGAEEARQAVAAGATLLIANQIDRLTGLLYPMSAVDVRDAVVPETVVAAKGGISSLEDAKQLARCGLDSVVLGRALLKSDAFELIKGLKRISAGPRALVHLFAGAEAAAAAAEKAREEEKEARRAQRNASKEQNSRQDLSDANEATGSPAIPAPIRSPPSPPVEEAEQAAFSEEPSGILEGGGLALAASQEVYRNTQGFGGTPAAPRDEPVPRFSVEWEAPKRVGTEEELKAIDESLKTRVLRVGGPSGGTEGPEDAPRGLRVFHSFDFCNAKGPVQPIEPHGKAPVASSDSNGGCSGNEGGTREDSSAAALRAACEDLLIGASEDAVIGGTGSTDELVPFSPQMSFEDPVQGSTPPGVPGRGASETVPRKVYFRNDAGEIVEAVVDPLAEAAKDLDPKLVDSLIEEARADPKAFAAAAEQQILHTWRQAEEFENLDGGPPPFTREGVSSKTAILDGPMGLPKHEQEPLLEGPGGSRTEVNREDVPWAAPRVPGASKEEVKTWLKDLELQRMARFFLTPEESADFFGRLQAAADKLWGPTAENPSEPRVLSKAHGTDNQATATQIEKGPCLADKASQPRPSLPADQVSAPTPMSAAVTPTSQNSVSQELIPPAPLHQELAPSEADQRSSGSCVHSNTGPAPQGMQFTVTESPVSYGEWLLRPRSQEEPVGQRPEEVSSPTAFSRVGCVDAKPPLLNATDSMEPYIQYFQQGQQQQQNDMGPLDTIQPAAGKGRLEQERRLAAGDVGPSPGASVDYTEEDLRHLLPLPDTVPQRSLVDELADSGGIEPLPFNPQAQGT